jgi:5-methylcytosine-specific restriction endonuclease McrBC regulatory subunit McrC
LNLTKKSALRKKSQLERMGASLSWKPVRRIFKRGDTVYDSLNNHMFFMPKVTYRRVGARSRNGSVEGEYNSKKSGFNQYQSVLRSCRMVLTEKVNPILSYEHRMFYKIPISHPVGAPVKYVWVFYLRDGKKNSKYLRRREFFLHSKNGLLDC